MDTFVPACSCSSSSDPAERLLPVTRPIEEAWLRSRTVMLSEVFPSYSTRTATAGVPYSVLSALRYTEASLVPELLLPSADSMDDLLSPGFRESAVSSVTDEEPLT